MKPSKFLFLSLVMALAFGSSAQASILLSEGFDDLDNLAGWVGVNNSSPIGPTDWFQGNPGVFGAYQGAPNSYAAANFLNADVGGNISNWGMTPVLPLDGIVAFSFFTRTESGAPYPDRLEIRLSANGASTDVGNTWDSVGDFGILLMTINPGLDFGGYPEDWTKFFIEFTGLPDGTTGRLAFRYFVTDTNANGDYIGIDSVQVEAVPEPASLALVGSGIAVLAILRRKFRS